MIQILWGSQTGNAANLAQVISDSLMAAGFETSVHDMGAMDPEEIHDFERLVIVTSTYGDGEAPDNASEWLSYLKFGEDLKLPRLHYAVLGLGDPYYPHFCQCGKDFDEFLNKRGATPLIARLDCDRYFEEQYPEWVNSLIQVLKKSEAD